MATTSTRSIRSGESLLFGLLVMLIALIVEVVVVALLLFLTGGIGVSAPEMLALGVVAVVVGAWATVRRYRGRASEDSVAVALHE